MRRLRLDERLVHPLNSDEVTDEVNKCWDLGAGSATSPWPGRVAVQYMEASSS